MRELECANVKQQLGCILIRTLPAARGRDLANSLFERLMWRFGGIAAAAYMNTIKLIYTSPMQRSTLRCTVRRFLLAQDGYVLISQVRKHSGKLHSSFSMITAMFYNFITRHCLIFAIPGTLARVIGNTLRPHVIYQGKMNLFGARRTRQYPTDMRIRSEQPCVTT